MNLFAQHKNNDNNCTKYTVSRTARLKERMAQTALERKHLVYLLFLQFPIPVKHFSLTADNLCEHKQNCENVKT